MYLTSHHSHVADINVLGPRVTFLTNKLLSLSTLQAPDEIQLLKYGLFYNIRSSSRAIAGYD